MSTFVLVHGAWHGGWAWQLVAPRLRAAGHEVLAPTLTGLGERAHLLSPEVGLSTHVEDVAAVLRYEDLREVVLVGHSYAGMVITGAAGREPDRIGALIYYDAFVPEDGQCALDLLPPRVSEHFTESARRDGDGWLMPRRPLEALGVRDERAKAWLAGRLGPHPYATYADPLRAGPAARALPSAYIACTDWADVFAPHAGRARALGWPVREIAADHEALATAPDLLADAILELGKKLRAPVENPAPDVTSR